MRVVIPGGSGQVGQILARHFHQRGDEVTVISRSKAASPWRTLVWDGRSLGPWSSAIDGANVVINLAGRSVNCRYNERNRREILESRVGTTKLVGSAIAVAARPPDVWMNAATATIYRHALDRPMDEATGEFGGNELGATDTWNFSIDVAKAWEKAFFNTPAPGTRKLALRSAMTMSPDRGGVFDVLLGLVRHGLGGASGSGKQFVSWIHDHDFLAAVDFLIEHEAMEGAVNLASPQPLPNDEFMRELRRAWGMPVGLPAAEWMLEIGAFFLRTETELILKSRRVVPGRLLDAGFTFRFPKWPDAARDLVERWRKERNAARA
jgi:uncharacterized protein (TIGR01777 family)